MIPTYTKILAYRSYKEFLLSQETIESLMDMAFKKNKEWYLNSEVIRFLQGSSMMGVNHFLYCKNKLIEKILDEKAL